MSTQLNITTPKESNIADKRIQEFGCLYRKLVSLLQQQISQIQQGNIEGMEKTAEQCAGYVEKIGLMKLLDKERFKAERQQLRDLYGKLCLLITDQKQKTSDEIEQVRKVRKVLGVYRKNV